MSADWDPYTFTDGLEASPEGGDYSLPPPRIPVNLTIDPDEHDEGVGECDGGDNLVQDDDGNGIMSDDSHLLAKLQDAFVSGDTFERKGAARRIVEVFRQLYYTEGDVNGVGAVIEKLVEDGEQSVRTEVVEQLPHLALFCHEESPRLDHVVPKYVLPHIVRLLTDHFTQVRQSAQSGLMFLVERGIIASSQVAEYVLPVILDYTQVYAPADLRAEMTMFMIKLAPLTGKEITVNSYLDLYCRLCEDSMFQVRRACAMGMGDVASVVGTRLTEEILLPKFLTLCKDTVWGVRKGCAEVFTVVATMSQLVTRNKILAPAFVTLLKDSSRWVRISAYQTLGSFITTFGVEDSSSCSQESSEIEQMFIDRYMARQEEKIGGTFSALSDEMSADAVGGDSHIITPLTRAYECRKPRKIKIFEMEDSTDDTECDLLDERIMASYERMDENPVAEHVLIEAVSDVTEQTEEVVSPVESECSVEVELNDLPLPDDKENDVPAPKITDSTEDLSLQLTESENSNGTTVDSGKEQSEDSAIGSPAETEQLSEINVSTNKGSPLEDANIIESAAEATDCAFSVEEVKLEPRSEYECVNIQSVKDAVSLLTLEESETVDLGEPMEMDQDYREMEAPGSLTDDGSALDFRPRLNSILSPMPNSRKKTVMTTPEYAGRDAPGVHRSYANLYKATRDTNGAEDPFLNGRFRMLEAYLNDDFDPDSMSGDEFRQEMGGWGARGPRQRLLEDIPILTPLHQNVVPVDLLQHYTSMCEPLKNPAIDNALTNFCAFNLPAVVLTLGPQNWSILRDCYESLACNMQWKIRYTLACSLHEIARVIGPELTERDLLPFFHQLVKDVDEVRVGLLRNLHNFIKILGVTERTCCLETLKIFLETDNKRNWRFRLELANQLELLTDLYGATDVYRYLRPIAVDLIKDSVAEVRKAARSVISRIIIRISETAEDGQNYVHDFITELAETLRQSDKWVRRQTFAALAGNLVHLHAVNAKQFSEEILPHLIGLSSDTVPNVRLIVAQTMVSCVRKYEFDDGSSKMVSNVIQNLQEDVDTDVRYYCSMDSGEDGIRD